MLLFYPAARNQWRVLARNGVQDAHLLTSLPETDRDSILVVDAARIAGLDLRDDGTAQAPFIPPAAFLNADPYLPPRPVTAAGGFVLRPGAAEPLVLVIFRRGVWDLPKGKLDKGETIEACALREVREEVGIRELRLLGTASTTVHGYPEKGKYRVKTTYWYFMNTPQEHFTPQAEEDIERVEWMPWSEARHALGYESLQRHMQEVEAVARQVADSLI